MATSPALHISRDRFHLAWDPAIPPIETVHSGAEVEFDLLDASGGQLTASSTVADLAALDFNRVDQVNGPIAVDGARPGDVLQIDLLEFEPADWGWTASIPGFGLLADDFPDPAYHVTAVPRVGERAEFLPGVRVPVVPFCGELGVAPETGPRSTIPPDLHGGNMDTRHLTAGATLFLPVFHEGARFSIGDGHAAQGDGEVCGTAIETPMRALVRLTVRKDLALRAPEFIELVSRIDTGPLHVANKVELFFNGQAAFASVHEAINAARKEVLLETYILRDDSTGLEMRETLSRASFLLGWTCHKHILGGTSAVRGQF